MMRKQVLMTVAVLSLAGAAWAAPRQGVLKDKDGRVYEGMIDEKDDIVLVNVRGIESRIPKANVQSIAYGEFEEQFKTAQAALKKDDIAGRIALARKAFDASRYDLAQVVLEEAVNIDPNNIEAADLLKMTLSHRRFDKGTDHTPATHTPGTTGTTPTTPHGVWTLLSAEQVNRIKQLELNPADDQKINISFDKGVKSKYFDANPTMTVDNQPMDRVSWNRLPPFTAAMQIIKNGGDFAKDVRITGDPATIMSFKKTVQPILLQGCATSACHGGNNEASRKFPVINPAADNMAAYTNFYVITTFKSKAPTEGVVEGVFNPTQNRVVDRAAPEKSLLLAYGLSQQLTDLKHPPVKNMTPIFNKGGKTDERYVKVQDWIRSLDDIDKETEYGFTFMPERTDPAGPETTTRPATTRPAESHSTETHPTEPRPVPTVTAPPVTTPPVTKPPVNRRPDVPPPPPGVE